MKNLKNLNNNIFRNLFIILMLLFSINVYGADNKILFKINNKPFTSFDLEMRMIYLDFVGNNEDLDEEIIINDFISANLFYEYFKKSKDKNNYEQKINEIYNNILETNKINNKEYKYEINKNNIIFNIRLDYIRKSILESFLNIKLKDSNISNKEIDLLYKFKIQYINLELENIEELENKIRNLENLNVNNVIKLLNNNKIDFFFKEKEINNIESIDKRIKENILSNKNFFTIKNKNKLSIIFLTKNFETYNGIIFNLYSVKSNNEINKNKLKCESFINNDNYLDSINKEYELSSLNNDLKNNLININDFVTYYINNEYVYIILCEIKFDKEILNNNNLNKLINLNVSEIENNFINKYSRIYNLIITNE